MRIIPCLKPFSGRWQKILFHGFLFSHGFASLLNSGMSTDVRSLNSKTAIIELFKEASELSWKGLSQPSWFAVFNFRPLYYVLALTA
ncbi:MAG: hypothetical protein R2874_16800 [Desulfobacterales bacterium]